LVRFDFEMAELQLPEPHPCPWDPLINIGRLAEDAVTRHWGPGALADVVDEMLTSSDASPTLTRLLQAQQFTRGDEKEARREPSLLPLQDMRRAILGSVVNLIAHKLPEDEEKLAGLIKQGHDQLAREVIAEGIRGAEQSMGDYLQRALKHTSALVETVRARK
jgi:hypothetical protein